MSDTNYKFKLLEESSETKDMLEGQTHKRIAEALYESIYGTDSNGITIGLEGGWGTGKSTIISLLKTKIEPEIKSKKTYFFYFDAWEHEGDPLRRIFLEELIIQVSKNSGNKEKFIRLQEQIANRRKTTTTRTRQTATWLGKLLGLLTLFVPLGVGIISNQEPIKNPTDISLIQFIGIFLSIAPLFVVLLNLLVIIGKKEKRKSGLWKGICSRENWMFLQGEANTEMKQDISEEEERSSVEFEKFFDKVIRLIISDQDSRLLIVIDNLDRVNRQDSLKIWSTLQTYLQRRNPSSGSDDLFNRIWTIVPYDETGLMQLWETETAPKENVSKQQSENDHVCAKSYFDKCFQLRLHVPRITLSGWEDFCQKKMKESLVTWRDTEINSAVNILRWSRKGVNDSPTPREIKTFINQVGILRTYMHNEVGVEAIAYFVIEKYLESKTSQEIEKDLISGNLPKDILLCAFNSGEEVRSELCAIVFSTSPTKGVQMLLEPVIERALFQGNGNELKKCYETYQGAFWTVLGIHIQRGIDVEKVTNYALAVRDGLLQEQKHSSELKHFSMLVVNSIPKTNGITSKLFPEYGNSAEHFLSFFEIIKVAPKKTDLSEWLYTEIGNTFVQQCTNIADAANLFTNFEFAIHILYTLRNLVEDSKQIDTSSLGYEEWINIFSELKKNGIELEHIFKITEPLIQNIASTKITGGHEIPSEVVELTRYGKNNINQKWMPMVSQLQDYIISSNGNFAENLYPPVFQLINLLGNAECEDIKSVIKEIMQTQAFWNMSHNPKAIAECSFVIARFMLEEQELSNFSGAMQKKGVDTSQVKNWWQTNNDTNAQFVWEMADTYSDYSFIWHLSTDYNNKLIGTIIEIALDADNERSKEFFNHGNPWENYKNTYALLADRDGHTKKEIGKYFGDHTRVEKDMLKANMGELSGCDEAIYYLLKNNSSPEIVQKVINFIKTFDTAYWSESFVHHGYPTKILLILSLQNSTKGILERIYCDAYLQYIVELMGNLTIQPKLKKDDMQNLFLIIHPDIQKYFSSEITKKLIELSFKINESTVPFILSCFDHRILFQKSGDEILQVIQSSLTTNDLGKLKFVCQFLKKDKSKLFSPEPYLTKVLENDFNRIATNTKSGEDKAMIIYLASVFSVEIKEQDNEPK